VISNTDKRISSVLELRFYRSFEVNSQTYDYSFKIELHTLHVA
jgi:hypothetical protein